MTGGIASGESSGGEVEEHDVVRGVAVRASPGAARGRATGRGSRAGRSATSRVAAFTAASQAGVPAVSVSEV